FFTPIVDDAFDWGRIGAANAFSDVYAMGGRPVTALNLVAWPVEELSLDLLGRVLEGGAEVARQAGVIVLGGHSIHDPEPKYGMAVTGFVDPERIVRNSTMRPGDRLILTKPLGLGILTTAVKRGRATPEQLDAAVEVMTTLNRAASEAMVDVGVSAATDVTGFGLLGHLHNALVASGAAARVDAAAVPLLSGTLELAEQGVVPSGTRSNHDFVGPSTDWGELPVAEQLVLADAQTSGGLLISVPGERADTLHAALTDRDVPATEIGEVVEGEAGWIRLEGRLGA
ncbi:MAG TPA: selenide, water dikinase SelD, partial [Actinomycetota bacterium]|nr:selenide, water dikinase SelD [Actinomycetota bacterium]